MKKIALFAFLLASISSYSQVTLRIKNTSNALVRVYDPMLNILDTIPANGVGKLHSVPAVKTDQEIFIFAPQYVQHMNSDRSKKDTTYTSGLFSLILSYNQKTHKWYSKLKPL